MLNPARGLRLRSRIAADDSGSMKNADHAARSFSTQNCWVPSIRYRHTSSEHRRNAWGPDNWRPSTGSRLSCRRRLSNTWPIRGSLALLDASASDTWASHEEVVRRPGSTSPWPASSSGPRGPPTQTADIFQAGACGSSGRCAQRGLARTEGSEHSTNSQTPRHAQRPLKHHHLNRSTSRFWDLCRNSRPRLFISHPGLFTTGRSIS